MRFHDQLGDRLATFEQSHGLIDLIVLAYHRWIHGSLLERYRRRIINQHPADLAELSATGHPIRAFVGNDPVMTALRSGRPATRTSTFLVDESHDGGPILARGPWVTYDGMHPVTTEAAQDHEMRQKQLSDPASLAWTIRALAQGRLALDERYRHPDDVPLVRLDGHPLPYGGFEAPPYHVPQPATPARW